MTARQRQSLASQTLSYATGNCALLHKKPTGQDAHDALMEDVTVVTAHQRQSLVNQTLS